jgi:hypothetical protein
VNEKVMHTMQRRIFRIYLATRIEEDVKGSEEYTIRQEAKKHTEVVGQCARALPRFLTRCIQKVSQLVV